jgi:hypothetical protein
MGSAKGDGGDPNLVKTSGTPAVSLIICFETSKRIQIMRKINTFWYPFP